MDKLLKIINEIVEKYNVEQADIDKIDQAVMEMNGIMDMEGEEAMLPEMGYGDEENDQED